MVDERETSKDCWGEQRRKEAPASKRSRSILCIQKIGLDTFPKESEHSSCSKKRECALHERGNLHKRKMSYLQAKV